MTENTQLQDPLVVASGQINEGTTQLANLGNEYVALVESEIHKSAQPASAKLLDLAVKSSIEKLRTGVGTIASILSSIRLAAKNQEEKIALLQKQLEEEKNYTLALLQQFESSGIKPVTRPEQTPAEQA